MDIDNNFKDRVDIVRSYMRNSCESDFITPLRRKVRTIEDFNKILGKPIEKITITEWAQLKAFVIFGGQCETGEELLAKLTLDEKFESMKMARNEGSYCSASTYKVEQVQIFIEKFELVRKELDEKIQGLKAKVFEFATYYLTVSTEIMQRDYLKTKMISDRQMKLLYLLKLQNLKDYMGGVKDILEVYAQILEKIHVSPLDETYLDVRKTFSYFNEINILIEHSIITDENSALGKLLIDNPKQFSCDLMSPEKENVEKWGEFSVIDLCDYIIGRTFIEIEKDELCREKERNEKRNKKGKSPKRSKEGASKRKTEA
jgi:hypothetical protein